jgi:hypothetical protein
VGRRLQLRRWELQAVIRRKAVVSRKEAALIREYAAVNRVDARVSGEG